jgi:hypothetical protein
MLVPRLSLEYDDELGGGRLRPSREADARIDLAAQHKPPPPDAIS